MMMIIISIIIVQSLAGTPWTPALPEAIIMATEVQKCEVIHHCHIHSFIIISLNNDENIMALYTPPGFGFFPNKVNLFIFFAGF